jgi:hypothetical protein
VGRKKLSPAQKKISRARKTYLQKQRRIGIRQACEATDVVEFQKMKDGEPMYGIIKSIQLVGEDFFSGTVESLSGTDVFEFAIPHHEGTEPLKVGQLVEFSTRVVADHIRPASTSGEDRMHGFV